MVQNVKNYRHAEHLFKQEPEYHSTLATLWLHESHRAVHCGLPTLRLQLLRQQPPSSPYPCSRQLLAHWLQVIAVVFLCSAAGEAAVLRCLAAPTVCVVHNHTVTPNSWHDSPLKSEKSAANTYIYFVGKSNWKFFFIFFSF